MNAYFQRDGIALYHGDALDVLPRLDLTADLLLADPPYGVDYQSSFRKTALPKMRNDSADRSVVLAILSAAVDRLREQRHAYVFGPLSEEEAESLRLTALAELIWDKGIPALGDLSISWGTSHERITFAAHYPRKPHRRSGRGGLSARLRRGTVLREQRPHGAAITHPTEKPTGILRQMIESSTVLGEMVLDPFAGSGSSLVAAAMEGRCAIGIEIEERWCEEAAKRMDALTRQTILFPTEAA